MTLIILLSVLLFSFTISTYIRSQENYFFKLTISFILSLSFLSLLFSVSLFLNIPYFYYITALLGLDITAIYFLRKEQFKRIELSFRINESLILFMFIILAVSILFWYKTIRWGEWDAWAIWNCHAKYLFYENSWTSLFTNNVAHSDYPLMLPSLIAIFWKSLGSIHPIVPAVIAYVVFICILSLIYSSVNQNHFKYIGILMVLFLILDYRLIPMAASQYADTLVSLLILLTIILLSKQKENTNSYYLLIGFFASLPLWVKNEGIVFFIFTSILIVFQNYKDKRKIFSFIVGALPIILIYTYFKTAYAPDNDIVSGVGGGTIEKIFTLDRYVIIIKNLTHTLIFLFPFLTIITITTLIVHPKVLLSGITLVIATTLASYLFVYVITPHDINWHLNTSLSRLIHQLHPSIIYYCTLILYEKYQHPIEHTSARVINLLFIRTKNSNTRQS